MKRQDHHRLHLPENTYFASFAALIRQSAMQNSRVTGLRQNGRRTAIACADQVVGHDVPCKSRVPPAPVRARPATIYRRDFVPAPAAQISAKIARRQRTVRRFGASGALSQFRAAMDRKGAVRVVAGPVAAAGSRPGSGPSNLRAFSGIWLLRDGDGYLPPSRYARRCG